jgi:tetratricopeptide (TPR) repeat protein
MKTACFVCSAAKGRRVCQLKDHSVVCPACCARIRNPDCEGCSYWAQALAYAREKTAAAPRPPHFVIRIDPGVDAEVDRAMGMVERGRLEAADRLVSGLLHRHPDLHGVQFAMGVVRAFQRRHDEALAHFDQAIAIFPHFVEAWFNKGAAHRERLEMGPMIRAFQKVIEFGDPEDHFVAQARSVIRDLDKQTRADKGFSLDRYLQLMDVFDEAYAAMEHREWDRALLGFKQVAAADPKSVQSYGNMGLCYAFLGRKREALEALDRALEIDPGYAPARRNRLCVLAMEEGDRTAADFISIDYYRELALARG